MDRPAYDHIALRGFAAGLLQAAGLAPDRAATVADVPTGVFAFHVSAPHLL